MQEEKNHSRQHRIPEHYLFWTFDHPKLLTRKLYTHDGRSLVFLEKGRLNFDNGPDYLNALVKIDDIRFRGDLEFHVNWQDWFRHGHDNDRRYDRVILHILWETPDDIPSTLLKRFPHLVLSRFLRTSPEAWLDCMRNLAQTDDPLDCQRTPRLPDNFRFKKFAWQRFRRKITEIEDWVNNYGWETTAYLGLAKVLGHSKNSDAFVGLVKTFIPSHLVSVLRPPDRLPQIYWLLMGQQGGLFTSQNSGGLSPDHSQIRSTLHYLQRHYRQFFPLKRQDLMQWNFGRLRPQNSPYVRLAGFCQLLFLYQSSSLFGQLLEIYAQRWPLPKLMTRLESALCQQLSQEFDPLLDELGLTNLAIHQTMGRQRCQLYQVNFLLPLIYLWATVNKNHGFVRYVEDVYFQFPSVDNNAIIHSFVRQQKELICSNAYHHQALLEYYSLHQQGG